MSADRARYSFDHHTTEFAQDPWRVYRRMQRECPVAYSDTYDDGFWVLTGYDDVRACALDPETFSSAMDDLLIPVEHAGRLLPQQSDPPISREYRRVINHLFTVRAVRAVEPDITRYAREAIDAFASTGTCELNADLACPVPGRLTMKLVGWPEDDWAQVVIPIRTFATHPVGSEPRARAARELKGVRERIVAELEARRRQPQDDLVSHLLRSQVEGREITDEEIVGLVMMVLFGGVDTTVAAISNMLTYLDDDRAMRQRLIDDPELIPVAVDELLRYQAPVQGFTRVTRADTTVRDQHIASGETVYLSWAAANRDPQVFADPDSVRLDRGSNPHLAFGIGLHRCLGATLARVELRITLAEVLRRIPDYEIVRDQTVLTPTAGTTYSRIKLPAVFTPTT